MHYLYMIIVVKMNFCLRIFEEKFFIRYLDNLLWVATTSHKLWTGVLFFLYDIFPTFARFIWVLTIRNDTVWHFVHDTAKNASFNLIGRTFQDDLMWNKHIFFSFNCFSGWQEVRLAFKQLENSLESYAFR